MRDRRTRWAAAALVLLVAVIYAQAWQFEFIDLDDNEYVTQNAVVQDGLSPASLQWAFALQSYSSNWHPLTWLSLMLDAELFGGFAGGFHLTNLLIHAGNSVLLFLVLLRLYSRFWPSLAVAALFAVHPLHVEAVAWVSERKELLGTFFGLISLWAYVAYVQKGGALAYVGSVLCLALSLLSKQMLVSLPLVFLCLDVWPLQRLTAASDVSRCRRVIVWEKLPFVALSVTFSVMVLLAQSVAGSTASLHRYPIDSRFANAIVAYATYLAKMVWPVNLAVYYPHPGTHALLTVVASAVLLTVISVTAVLQFRRRPYLLMGWLWYLITLVPVIGLVQVGEQAFADRYTYFPLIGIFIAVVWLIAEAWPQLSRRISSRWLAAAVCMPLLALTVVAWRQAGYWRNSETLFQHTLAVTGDNWLIEAALGSALLAQPDRWNDAESHLRRAIRLRPDYPDAHFHLGLLLSDRQQLPLANAEFREAIAARPEWVQPRVFLCLNLKRLGERDQLRAELEALRRTSSSLPPEIQSAIFELQD